MRLIKNIELNRYFIVVLLMSAFLLTQCDRVKSYEQLVEKEMASDIRNDTLFLGIYFGMSSEDFYKHCWTLNKNGTLKDGFGNMTAAYKIDQLKYPAHFEFYPTFNDDKIHAMPAYVHYDAFAPWNHDLSAINLLEETKSMMEDWYDVTFYPIVPRTIFGKAYVSISGNRKIVIYYSLENRVEIVYTNLNNGDDVPVVFKLD